MTGLAADIQPAGALEHDLFTQFAHASWNLRRCRIAERELQNSHCAGLDLILDAQVADRLRLIDLYTRRSNRANHRLLKALQTNRQSRPPAAVVPADRRDTPASTQRPLWRTGRCLRYTEISGPLLSSALAITTTIMRWAGEACSEPRARISFSARRNYPGGPFHFGALDQPWTSTSIKPAA
jgi:hypothetical protein